MGLRQELLKLEAAQRQLLPAPFVLDKKDIIDYAFTRCRHRPTSFADLGGVWFVEAAYTFYALDRYEVGAAYLVDTDITPTVAERALAYPALRTLTANFGDFATVAKTVPPVDAVFLFDVLLHQVGPNWDEVLAHYAARAKILVIYNPQWIGGDETLRLFDLGRDGYFANVPHTPHEPPYDALFDKLDETHPEHRRPWRDIHNVWQWGITDSDLKRVMDEAGYALRYYRDCGAFGLLRNFEAHAFVFERR